MRVLHNTLVNITNEHMGSQSVLFEGTVVYENVRSPIIQLLGRAGKIISDNCSIFSIMPHSDQSFESSD